MVVGSDSMTVISVPTPGIQRSSTLDSQSTPNKREGSLSQLVRNHNQPIIGSTQNLMKVSNQLA